MHETNREIQFSNVFEVFTPLKKGRLSEWLDVWSNRVTGPILISFGLFFQFYRVKHGPKASGGPRLPQVLLRWALDQQVAVIPGASSEPPWDGFAESRIRSASGGGGVLVIGGW